jgi:Ser/Thr protein kinase RdoA (MazF antagonist)
MAASKSITSGHPDAVYKGRIGYTGNLNDLAEGICTGYRLGKLVSTEIVKFGYEDLNMVVKTDKGKYFVKILSRNRDVETRVWGTSKRYMDTMNRASYSGANVPKLMNFNVSYFSSLAPINSAAELKVCVMEFIDGENLYASGINLTESEIKTLAKQVALIDKMDLKPEPIYDEWSIVNFANEFKAKGKYLEADDRTLIEPVLEEFNKIKLAPLPHCFVHGDILKTNVIKDKTGKLWIVDFAVSNYYPRIVELAVLACNVLFDENSKEVSESNLKSALKEYEKYINLTEEEHRLIPLFVRAAHAMHLLSANYQKVVNGNSTKENEYWMKQGRTGLS